MQIKKTVSYKKFKLMKGNRDIDPMQINILKRSIEKMPQLLPALPIVVNEKFEILDGQHRFHACKSLKQPVYYIVVDGLGLDEVRQMNTTSQRWTMINYAQSYASMGIEDYSYFLDLHEKFPEISATALGTYMTGLLHLSGFRAGKFRMRYTLDQIMDSISKLYDIAEEYPHTFEKPFTTAFQKIIQNEDYDHSRMLQQISNARHILLEAQSRVYKDCLRILEEVYNYGYKHTVRLF